MEIVINDKLQNMQVRHYTPDLINGYIHSMLNKNK